MHQREPEPGTARVTAFLPAAVVADDDLDHAVADAGVDMDGDRPRLPRVRDRVAERLVGGEEDVHDLVFDRMVLGQPDPQVRAQQGRLGRPGRQAQAETLGVVV